MSMIKYSFFNSNRSLIKKEFIEVLFSVCCYIKFFKKEKIPRKPF